MLTRFAYLVIVAVVGLGTIGLFQLTRGRPVEATSILTGPAQSLVSAPLYAIEDLVANIDSVRRLRRENDALRAEIDRLREGMVRLPELEHENQLLRDQANYRKSQTEHELLSARIIGRDPDPLGAAVVIDQGTSDGLADGVVVGSPAGLVGRIERAGPSSSKVLLITATASAVNCVVQG